MNILSKFLLASGLCCNVTSHFLGIYDHSSLPGTKICVCYLFHHNMLSQILINTHYLTVSVNGKFRNGISYVNLTHWYLMR